MSTEYRRGIPSRERIEAATRLGLEWETSALGGSHRRVWRFAISDGEILCDSSANWTWSSLRPLADGRVTSRAAEAQSYRPIRPDGTLVDWSVLDAEVAQVQGPIVGTLLGINENGTVQARLNADNTVSPATQAQPRRQGGSEPRRFTDVRPDRHGWRWWRIALAPTSEYLEGCRFETRNRGDFRWQHGRWVTVVLGSWLDRAVIPTDEQGNPVPWESIAQAAPTTAPMQPLGFRAYLWRRMLRSFFGAGPVDTRGLSLSGITARENDRMFRFDNGNVLALSGMSEVGYTDADILARWAVYQELKPLYAIVDGAQGEAPMSEDVEAAWTMAANMPCPPLGYWRLGRDAETFYLINPASTRWLPHESGYGVPLRDFAAVLDAVAEQRVQARQTQTEQPTLNGQPMPLVSFQQTLDAVNSGITQAVLGKVEAPVQAETAQPSYFDTDGDTVSTPAAGTSLSRRQDASQPRPRCPVA